MRTYVSSVERDVDKLISFSLGKYDCKLKKNAGITARRHIFGFMFWKRSWLERREERKGKRREREKGDR